MEHKRKSADNIGERHGQRPQVQYASWCNTGVVGNILHAHAPPASLGQAGDGPPCEIRAPSLPIAHPPPSSSAQALEDWTERACDSASQAVFGTRSESCGLACTTAAKQLHLPASEDRQPTCERGRVHSRGMLITRAYVSGGLCGVKFTQRPNIIHRRMSFATTPIQETRGSALAHGATIVCPNPKQRK